MEFFDWGKASPFKSEVEGSRKDSRGLSQKRN